MYIQGLTGATHGCIVIGMQTTSAAEYRINFSDRRAARHAIATIKECGGRFDSQRKLWTVDPANCPKWQLATWRRYAAYAGMTDEQIITDRINTMAGAAELVTR